MADASTPRRDGDADRLQLTLVIALAAAAVAGLVVFGHGPAEAGGVPAGQATHAQALPVSATADRSLPDAAQALRTAPADAAEPTASF